MSCFKMGETVIVKGTVSKVQGTNITVLFLGTCDVIQRVRAAPKVGDLVKIRGTSGVGVVTLYDPEHESYKVDGKSELYAEVDWPTEEEVKEHKLKQLLEFDDDALFAEIVRRKDERRKQKEAAEMAAKQAAAPAITTGCMNAVIGYEGVYTFENGKAVRVANV